jgi:hypothetical protein
VKILLNQIILVRVISLPPPACVSTRAGSRLQGRITFLFSLVTHRLFVVSPPPRMKTRRKDGASTQRSSARGTPGPPKFGQRESGSGAVSHL